MNFKRRAFDVDFTEQAIEELTEIYDYISTDLKESRSAKKLINQVNEKILKLSQFPNLYMKIGKTDDLKRDYHKMVIKNYVVLYTVDYEKEKVFISRVIYQKRNYLN